MIITRKGNFDSMHRIMDHPSKCAAIHGHTYLYEIQIDTTVGDIGYGIDFADVKTILQYYIDGYLDHGAILNPADVDIIQLCESMKSKHYIMKTLRSSQNYMNPSAENISREMYYVLHILFKRQNIIGYNGINNIRLYETPNCYVDFSKNNFTDYEYYSFVNDKKLEPIFDNI